MRQLLAFAALVVLAGCTTDDTQRLDGMTYGAGDAIAANTVMQMVDPWQYGVQHTDLKVPAERAASAASAEGDAKADGSKTTSTGKDN